MAPNSADPSNPDHPRVHVADESTPLLLAPEPGVIASANDSDDLLKANGHIAETQDESATDGDDTESKPMPYGQIFLLCSCSISEPIAYFAIFPFINEMLERTGGLDEKNVGFWSGLIESLFSLVQMLLMIFYGRAADRLGRKPVLVFSLAGIAVATALFGMSQKLWVMVVMRCTAGVFAGSVVTVRTMISEMTTKETQGRAFSWYMFVRNLGILVGPLIGGGLANPAEQFPSVFGGIAFWEQYPYALATFAAGAVVLVSAITCFLFLNETLKRKVEGQVESEPPMSTWEVLRSPGVLTVLYIYGLIMLLALAYTAVSPVVMYTSVKLGGFGFSDQKIALFLALAGGSQALWMLLLFPYLQRTYGTGSVLRGCFIAWPVFMAGYPIMNELLRHGLTRAFWITAPIGMILGSGVAMSFAAIQLCVNDISPSPTVLGTLNALALTVSSGIRAFAPVAGTSLFALGIKWGFADGHLVWFFLVALALGLTVASWFLPERAEGRPKAKVKPDGDDGDI